MHFFPFSLHAQAETGSKSEIIISYFSTGREVTAFIDWDQVLYQVDKQSDKELDYWNQIYDRILNSFKLIPLEGESEAQFNEWLEDFNTAGADVVEPVEIIE